MHNPAQEKLFAAAIAIAVAFLIGLVVYGGSSDDTDEVTSQSAILTFQDYTHKITHKFAKGQNVSIVKPYGYCVVYTPKSALRITKHDKRNEWWDFSMRSDSVVTFQRISTHHCHTIYENLYKDQGILIEGYHPIIPGSTSREHVYIRSPWDGQFTIPGACRGFTLSPRDNGGNYKLEYQVMKPDGTYSPWLKYRDGQAIRTNRLWFRSSDNKYATIRQDHAYIKLTDCLTHNPNGRTR